MVCDFLPLTETLANVRKSICVCMCVCVCKMWVKLEKLIYSDVYVYTYIHTLSLYLICTEHFTKCFYIHYLFESLQQP